MHRIAAAAVLTATALLPACAEERPQLGQDASSPEVRERLGGQLSEVLDTTTAATLSGAFRGAASRALPSVVRIRTLSERPQQTGGFPFGPPTGQDGQAPLTPATGSGFIVDNRGHILTNAHVVADAHQVRVVLVDGREFEADLVGLDPNTDVAVIRARTERPEELPVAELGSSDELRVGDWVLALGSPLDLEFTVTAGIVSAKGRSLGILRNVAGTQLEAFIQTDAAINPGNSGGPLVDLLGRVVGINSAIQSQTGFFAGAGFAIPIDLAAKLARDLIQYGEVHRPQLGVNIDDVDAADAEVYGLSSIAGVEVVSVLDNAPASNAGMRMGDVIVEVAGEAVRTAAELQARVARLQPNETVAVRLVRFGEPLELEVRLGAFEPAALPDRRPPAARTAADLLGFRVAALPEEAAATAPVDGPRVWIREVDRFGPAGQKLGSNAILLRLNGTEVRTVAEVQRFADDLEAGDVVSAIVLVPQPDRSWRQQIVNYRAQ